MSALDLTTPNPGAPIVVDDSGQAVGIVNGTAELSPESQMGQKYPVIVSPRPARLVITFDDFLNVSWAKRLLPVGLLATPATATHKANIGGTVWEVAETTASGGSAAGPIGVGDATEYGAFYMKCGNTANDIIRAYPGSINDYPVAWARTNRLHWTFSVRLRFGPASAGESAATSSIRGFGFVSEDLNGATWVVDPASVFDGVNFAGALLVTRHSAAYGGAAAGNLVARAYPTNQIVTLVTAANFSGTAWYTIECSVAPTSRRAYWYVNGEYKGEMADVGFADDMGFYPSWEVKTLTAAGRNLSIDYIYSEQDPGSDIR